MSFIEPGAVRKRNKASVRDGVEVKLGNAQTAFRAHLARNLCWRTDQPYAENSGTGGYGREHGPGRAESTEGRVGGIKPMKTDDTSFGKERKPHAIAGDNSTSWRRAAEGWFSKQGGGHGAPR